MINDEFMEGDKTEVFIYNKNRINPLVSLGTPVIILSNHLFYKRINCSIRSGIFFSRLVLGRIKPSIVTNELQFSSD